MQFLLNEEEYYNLKNLRDEELKKWTNRSQNLFAMLVAAKKYPCINHGYCDSCELKHSDVCFKTKTYSK